MHNARSLLGGIKFHLSGSVEARANLGRAAPSGVVRAWVYFRQRWPTPTTRSDGEADIVCIHAHLPTHTKKYIQKRRPTSVYPVHVTGKPYRNNKSLLVACRCRPKL